MIVLKYHNWLVVTGTWLFFPFHIWVVILPIDELIFFKMVIAPPTRSDIVAEEGESSQNGLNSG